MDQLVLIWDNFKLLTAKPGLTADSAAEELNMYSTGCAIYTKEGGKQRQNDTSTKYKTESHTCGKERDEP